MEDKMKSIKLFLFGLLVSLFVINANAGPKKIHQLVGTVKVGGPSKLCDKSLAETAAAKMCVAQASAQYPNCFSTCTTTSFELDEECQVTQVNCSCTVTCE